jgi:hypothetical protein
MKASVWHRTFVKFSDTLPGSCGLNKRLALPSLLPTNFANQGVFRGQGKRWNDCRRLIARAPFSHRARVLSASLAAAILKFLQDARHSSLVACFAQFVYDRLRCNKS